MCKARGFLKRLQLKVSQLVEVVKFSPGAAAQKLFDRFMMGCHDEHILTMTNLHNQIIAPQFSQLISIIREAKAPPDAKLAQYKPAPKQPARSFTQQLDVLNLYGQSPNQPSSPTLPTPQRTNQRVALLKKTLLHSPLQQKDMGDALSK